MCHTLHVFSVEDGHVSLIAGVFSSPSIPSQQIKSSDPFLVWWYNKFLLKMYLSDYNMHFRTSCTGRWMMENALSNENVHIKKNWIKYFCELQQHFHANQSNQSPKWASQLQLETKIAFK